MRMRDDDIADDLKYLQETMERLLLDFSHLRMPILLGKESLWRPLTDVYETDKVFTVRMDIAGMDPEDLQIALRGRVLTIRGVRRDPKPPGHKHFHKIEISVGPFERNIEVPSGVQIGSIDASYDKGFLVINVRKGVGRLVHRDRVVPIERG